MSERMQIFAKGHVKDACCRGKTSKKTLENGKATHVYVAHDADKKFREEVISLAKEKAVTITYAESMVALGKDCGIAVPSAAAADICD